MTTFVTALFVGIYRQGYRNGCQGKEYEMQRTLIVRGAPGKEYGTTVADAINSVLKKNPESKLTNAIVLVFLEAFVRENYDLTSKGIIQSLGLLDVDYNLVSAYGHFGKAGLPWEQ